MLLKIDWLVLKFRTWNQKTDQCHMIYQVTMGIVGGALFSMKNKKYLCIVDYNS